MQAKRQRGATRCESEPPELPVEIVPQLPCFARSASSSGSLQRPSISTRLEELLDWRGVSNESIVSNAQREDRVFASKPLHSTKERLSLPPQARSVAVLMMLRMQQASCMSQTSWFDSVTTFDAYCACKPEGVAVDHLPWLCVALTRLKAKADGVRFAGIQANSFFASKLASSLQRLGFGVRWERPADFGVNILRHELDVMRVLDWRIQLPSVKSWLSWFIVRFNTLSRGFFVDSLTWVWHHGVQQLKRQVRTRPSSGDCPNRHRAHGLLALMLIRASLLPLEVLRSSAVDAVALHQLYMRAFQLKESPLCCLHPTHVKSILDMLSMSSGLTTAVLRRDARHEMNLYKEPSLQERQAQPQGHGRTHVQVEETLQQKHEQTP
eukprot:TRINITY_DN75447_c0_g1_i1.p1 TRINITY_DN75447_c0_g1~~TRINITY_DN75447_c0_g1_i1.p1  ORF type:complete len:414 (-),score=46.82 TRINITY_DN75447_c0_g1_i1:86-1228(-)